MIHILLKWPGKSIIVLDTLVHGKTAFDKIYLTLTKNQQHMLIKILRRKIWIQYLTRGCSNLHTGICYMNNILYVMPHFLTSQAILFKRGIHMSSESEL